SLRRRVGVLPAPLPILRQQRPPPARLSARRGGGIAAPGGDLRSLPALREDASDAGSTHGAGRSRRRSPDHASRSRRLRARLQPASVKLARGPLSCIPALEN